MLGADYYETDAEVAKMLADGKVPPIGIGENTKIRYTSLSLPVYICIYFYPLLNSLVN